MSNSQGSDDRSCSSPFSMSVVRGIELVVKNPQLRPDGEVGPEAIALRLEAIPLNPDGWDEHVLPSTPSESDIL